MPRYSGTVGGMGFCLGGTLTYIVATSSRVNGRRPDATVSYYSSGIHQMLGQADSIECPIMFHYGNHDPYIPEGQIVAKASADLAWERTLEFFTEHL